ncbi:MAG: KH domain-containing protein [Dehalococcoidia bacterium]|nr:KH domain-containing protein [Dehalococcoidia bacterium]MYA54221.1 KH domain-containing protein [Dehalococcoidia bacterium]
MDHAEANGKTVDDALKAALAKLNATVDEVDITVLDEGQRGGRLFGRGARDAVVRVERRAGGPRESAPEPPDTSIPRGRGARGGSGGAGRGGSGGPGRGRGGRRRGGSGGPRGGSGGGRRGPRAERAPELTEQDFFGEGETPPARSAPQRRGSGGGNGQPRSSSGDGPSRRDRSRRRRREENIEPDINAEEVDLAAEVVDSILQILEIDADINIREPVTAGDGLGSARAVIDISGDDLGMLIGRRGESLMAFQYVVNLIMTRRYPGRGSVTIDVEEYRRRREDQVVSLAERMAERVRDIGDSITLEPMSAAERRLVHLALVDDPDVETNSVGEGDSRKVVISLLED